MAATDLPGSGIAIYSELLLNIRQVSVVATLASASDSTTKAQLVDNGTVIRIHHRGHTQSVALSAPVATSGFLPIPNQPSMQLGFRIPVSAQVPKDSSFSLENQALPWNAVDMQDGSAILCRQCDHAIVKEGTITSWKDLPSENWAEMMEFWHCHKPLDNEKYDDEHLAKRGYGASNAISARPAVGFVDITSFMFLESDCNGLSVSIHAQALVVMFSTSGKKEVGPVGCLSHTVTWPSIQLPKKKKFSVFPAIRGQSNHCETFRRGMGSQWRR